MNKNRKNGFTLVELLVVIAILAILAVVSVVGYTSFTKKAQISKDTGVTTELNLILQGNEVSEGANKYPHEAMCELVDGGYDVTKFSPTTNNYNYVYDLSQNRFFLLDESYNVVAPSDLTISSDTSKLFGFASTQTEVNTWNNRGFSVYLKSGYNSSSVETTTGIDVGDKTDVNVTLKSSTSASSQTLKTNALKGSSVSKEATASTQKEFVVRTNGGALTVNNPEAVVSHFGSSDKVVIEAVAKHAEYSEIQGTLEVKAGEVTVESTAQVASIIAGDSSDSTESKAAPKITTTSGASVGTIVVNSTSVSVTVETGSKVEAVARGKEGVELTNNSNIKVNSNTTKTETTVIDTSSSSKFAGGIGTENSPYLISTLDQWKYLAGESKGTTTDGKLTYSKLTTGGNYFSVLTDLDFTNVNEWVQLTYFAGYIDFNNHSVVGMNADNKSQGQIKSYNSLFYEIVDGSSIKNLQFSVSSTEPDHTVKLIYVVNDNKKNSNLYNVLLENVKIDGVANVTDNNTGIFVYLAGYSNLTLKNCENYATIYNVIYPKTGVFVGCAQANGNSYCENINFINCINRGEINTVNGEVSILISNDFNLNAEVTSTGCVNYGTIVGKLYVENTNKRNLNVEQKGYFIEGTTKTLEVKDDRFVLNVENATSYEVVFIFRGVTGANGGIISRTFKVSSKDIVYAYKWVDDANKTAAKTIFESTTYIDGNQYVFVGEEKNGVHQTMSGQPSVVVYAYDQNKSKLSTVLTYSYPSN